MKNKDFFFFETITQSTGNQTRVFVYFPRDTRIKQTNKQRIKYVKENTNKVSETLCSKLSTDPSAIKIVESGSRAQSLSRKTF